MTCKNAVVLSASAVFLAACGSMPKTPELLVENAKSGAMFSEADTYTVKRPVAQVTAVLKEKSHECLRATVAISGQTGAGWQRNVYQLTPKLVAGKERTRLTLQSKLVEGPGIELGEVPPDGWYEMVVDAYPVDKNSTRVEVYFQGVKLKSVFPAIKHWTNGTNSGCPDLTT